MRAMLQRCVRLLQYFSGRLHALPTWARSVGIFVFAVLFVVTVLRIVSGSGNGKAEEEALPHVTVQTIDSGFTRSFTVTGEVEANRSATLTADAKSDVIAVHVRAGDTIEEGESLITLSSRVMSQDLDAAKASYAVELQNLRQSEITASRSVQTAEVALERQRINEEKLRKQNAAYRRQAEEALNAAKLNLSLSMAESETDLENVIRSTQTLASDALTGIDRLLEYSGEYQELGYVQEIHIGVRDPIQKVQMREKLGDAYKAYYRYVPTYDGALRILAVVEDALLSMLITMRNSVTSIDYPQSTVDEEITFLNGHLTDVRDLISSLRATKRDLDTTERTAGQTSQTLIEAEVAYEATTAEIEASERDAAMQVRQAEVDLESSIASADASRIGARATFTTSSNALDQATTAWGELTMTAPFQGRVAFVSVREGDEVQNGDSVVTVENDALLKVVAELSVLEVQGVQKGDIVLVSGEKARIASVAPSADPITKKFPVEIYLRSNTLKPGGFVDVTFTIEKRSNAARSAIVYLPVTAIHIGTAEAFVWVVTAEGVTERRVVKIGSIEGKFAEITDGVSSGDRVIIEGGRILRDEGVSVSVTNL